jgi:hypothetical protein
MGTAGDQGEEEEALMRGVERGADARVLERDRDRDRHPRLDQALEPLLFGTVCVVL